MTDNFVFTKNPAINSDGKLPANTIHVRKMHAGVITITREQLRAALRASVMPGNETDDSEVERILFGSRQESEVSAIYLGKKLREACGKCGEPVTWGFEVIEGWGEAMTAPCPCGNKMMTSRIHDKEMADNCREALKILKEEEQ